MAMKESEQRLPNDADPLVQPRIAAQQPGGLRGSATLTVQTRQAQRLVHGRAPRPSEGKPAIVGLVRFATTMRRIWTAASRDDPWADWKLLQTYEALTESREGVRAIHEQVENKLESMAGVEISIAESLEPVQVPLEFHNPYGYMGAYLISDYDQCVRAILTARHVGLMERDPSEKELYRAGRLVRSAFNVPQGWRFYGVTRDDVAANNARAQRALEAMPLPPQDILEGTLRAPVAPDIRNASARGASDNANDAAPEDDADDEYLPAGERQEVYAGGEDEDEQARD